MSAEHSTPSDLIAALWPMITRRMSERALSAVELVEDILRMHGPLRRREHELRAGDRVLNDDREILSRVGRTSGLGLALYLGNRRIAAYAVLDSGTAPELGGFADAQLVDLVLRRQETFRGVLMHGGRRQLVTCRPLMSGSATQEYGALGMIEAFQDLDTFEALLEATLRDRLPASAEAPRDDQADRMADVMHFIDDVARRLQLLALNGNIIAAQAGEHGRAFRVVCRELSSLAEQSKDAVSQVRRLMEELIPPEDDLERDIDESLPGPELTPLEP